MGGDGVHRGVKQRLVIGQQGAGLAVRDQPAAGGQGGRALQIGMGAVGGEDVVDLGALGVGQGDFVGIGADARQELGRGGGQQRGKRVAFQQEAVRDRRRVDRIGDAGGGEAGAGVFQKERHDGFVGGSDAGGDAARGQQALGPAAGGAVVEGPCLQPCAGGGIAEPGDKRVQRAFGGSVMDDHLSVLPVGSNWSRSQSPSRFSPSTVSRMARPGKTLTHQADCR